VRQSRKRRELPTFVAAALVATGCSLTTSFSDLTGGLADSGNGEADAQGIPDAQDDVATDAPLAADVTEASDAGDASDAGPSYRSVVLSDTPVAYYRLGESAGQPARSEVAAAVSGTYVGQLALGAPGAIVGDPNTAAQFTGVTGAVVMGDVFDFPNGAAFTIELWIKADVIDIEFRPIFAKRTVDEAGVQGYWLYTRLAGGVPAIQYESMRDDQYHVVGTPLTPGVFHHVVVAQDASSIALTVDGKLQSQSVTPLARSNNPTSFKLATDEAATSTNHHQGVLDEVVVYDRVLPLKRIQAHYAAGRAIADGG
jgi:trimeric autotransporter adhesin